MSNRLKRVFSTVLCAAVMLTMTAVPGTVFAENIDGSEAAEQTEIQEPANENENEADAVAPDQNEGEAEAEDEAQIPEAAAGEASVPVAVQTAAKQMNAAIAPYKFDGVTVSVTPADKWDETTNTVTACKGTVELKAVIVNGTDGTYDYRWYKEGKLVDIRVGSNSAFMPEENGTYYAKVNQRWDGEILSKKSKSITVNLEDHDLVPAGTKAATCTEEGHYAYWTCSKCGKMFSNASGTKEISAAPVIPKIAHSLTIHASYLDAKCTADGHKEHWECDSCNGLFWDQAGTQPATADEVKIAAHGLTNVDAEAATCTEDGNAEHWKCTKEDCGKLFADEDGTNTVTVADVTLMATGHDLEATAQKDATCTETGMKAYWTCSKCQKFFSDENAENEIKSPEVIPANGHNMKRVDKHDATCTEDGHEEYWRCEECGYLSSDREGQNEISNPVKISATGHDLGEWKVTKEATVQAKGIKERACRKCEYKETAEIPMLTADKNTDVKKAADKSAETGDDMNIALYGLLALAAAAGAAGTLYRRKTN